MNRIVATTAIAMLGAAVSAAAEREPDIMSEAELAAVVLKLKDPATRIGALRRLIRFSAMHLWEGSVRICSNDRKMDDLRRAGARAVWGHRNPETVEIALKDDDRAFRHWGVLSFETTHGRRENWTHLLPLLEKIAAQDDASLRFQAVFKLQCYPEARDFLKGRREGDTEKSPLVWLRLDFQSHVPESHAKFCRRTVHFLSSEDRTVRLEWLNFIAYNPRMAPMFQIQLSRKLENK